MENKSKNRTSKQTKKSGLSEKLSSFFTYLADSKNNESKNDEITEGCRVMLNIPEIKSKRCYEQMNPKYKEFINSSGNMVFTVHFEHKELVSFKEDPTWLFWRSDLIKINDSECDGEKI